MLVFWIIFNAFVVAMLALDLKIINRDSRSPRLKEAVLWSLLWISMAGAFAVTVYLWRGPQPALEFITGYLVEESLSVDNLFIFLMIFSYFKVPARYHRKVLFWGILGALVMRAVFILTGITLVSRFHWMIYVFGAFLVYTGIQMAVEGETSIEPEKNPVLKLFRRSVPMTIGYHGEAFFTQQNARRMATPLLAVLVVVETTDLLFAVDSIPAVLAITRDPFIVYTSNVFAILGLRSLYFVLSGAMQTFHLLHYGISAILVFVGAKMLLSNDSLELFGIRLHYQVSTLAVFTVIGGILAVSLLASAAFPKRESVPGPQGS